MESDRKRLLQWGWEAFLYPAGTLLLGLCAMLFLQVIGQGKGMWMLPLLSLPVAIVTVHCFGWIPLLVLRDTLAGVTQRQKIQIKSMRRDRIHSLKRLGLPENRRRYVLTDQNGHCYYLLATDSERRLLLSHPFCSVQLTYGLHSRVVTRLLLCTESSA